MEEEKVRHHSLFPLRIQSLLRDHMVEFTFSDAPSDRTVPLVVQEHGQLTVFSSFTEPDHPVRCVRPKMLTLMARFFNGPLQRDYDKEA